MTYRIRLDGFPARYSSAIAAILFLFLVLRAGALAPLPSVERKAHHG